MAEEGGGCVQFSAPSRVFSLPPPPTSWKKSRAEGHDSWCLAQGCGLSYGPRTTGILDGHTERAIRAPNPAQPQANRIQTLPTAGAASMGRVVLLTLSIGGILGRSAGCAGGVVWPCGGARWCEDGGKGKRAAWANPSLGLVCHPLFLGKSEEKALELVLGGWSGGLGVPWCRGSAEMRGTDRGIVVPPPGAQSLGLLGPPHAVTVDPLGDSFNVAPTSRAHDWGS